jgi:hypothetical protein
MITLVTGLWDIGRGELNEGWNRSFDYYLERFNELLKIDCNLIIFGDDKLETFVKERRDMSKTKFIKRNLDWFKNNEFYNKIQEIRTNPDWYNQVGWLKESTQARLEFYNPLVMSKMFLLHDALLLDTFNSEKLYWIDAGISNTVSIGYFTHDNALEKIDNLFDKFSFIVFPYEANTEVHGFDYSKMCDYAKEKTEFVARGGFFGGTKETIKEMNSLYYFLLKDTLKNNLMGTEESIFTIMTYLYPSLIDYVKINSDGLLYKFFEDVKNNNVIIETKQKTINQNYGSGVGLYVITFNSPNQFETLINSMLSYDSDFIYKTKKFLLDNSTDLTTTPKYKQLCDEYEFIHIKKNNLGICGGRQFVAEHFSETNLQFMIWSEDDMFFQNKPNETCRNGFNRYTPKLFDKCVEIMKKEDFDFLKINYSEFYGDNGTCWPWYNLGQDKREYFFPEAPNLPVQGYDPNTPKTKFNNIGSHKGLPYVDGEIYYCNWTHFISQNGNKKMFLDTKWQYPYENTWMSHHYQLTKKNELRGGLLLLTPVEHERFDHYSKELRKES